MRLVYLVYKFDTGRIGNESQADSVVGNQFDLQRRNGFIEEEISEIAVDYFIRDHRRETTEKLKKRRFFRYCHVFHTLRIAADSRCPVPCLAVPSRCRISRRSASDNAWPVVSRQHRSPRTNARIRPKLRINFLADVAVLFRKAMSQLRFATVWTTLRP